jgi:thiol-disulfide isomerase/thioredoxin
MKRTTLALACLSLIVSIPVFAQDTAKPAAPPKTIVQLVRDALNAKDFERAEKLAVAEMASSKESPISIEAFSWLARDLVSRKRYDEAMTYASRTYSIVEEQLKRRKLDDEARLPIALGAAIEVQAQAMAGQGRRSEAIMHLQREMELYKGSSIIMRLNKNLNMINLAGQPAIPVASAKEWLPGPKPPSFSELKGKPVVLFLWAHWCGDCKTQGPLLESVINKYKDSGVVVIAPTQRFGYADKRRPVGPEEELKYIEQVRDQFYPWMKNVSVPVSDDVYLKYGVSTTPTYVMIDREGKVSTYLPGQPTVEEIDALVRKIAGPVATSSPGQN